MKALHPPEIDLIPNGYTGELEVMYACPYRNIHKLGTFTRKELNRKPRAYRLHPNRPPPYQAKFKKMIKNRDKMCDCGKMVRIATKIFTCLKEKNND